MNDIELRLECIRIASENLKLLGAFKDDEVIHYATKLFDYIWSGPDMKKAA
jgi:hypothetical protein